MLIDVKHHLSEKGITSSWWFGDFKFEKREQLKNSNITKKMVDFGILQLEKKRQ